MKKFLIVFYNQRGPSNPVGGGLDPLLTFFDSREDIFTDWMVLFAQVALVVSTVDANKITRFLRKQFPHSLFLVMPVPADSQGWIPPEAWKFLDRE
jgi:hypothetical protein